MSWVTRGPGLASGLARELGMLLPRTVAGLNESTGWAPYRRVVCVSSARSC